jgi:site-specific DNA recombinase
MASLGLEFARGNLNATQVKVATDELEARLREVEAQLARLAKREVFDGLIGADDLKERWEGLSLDRKRAVIKALADKIEVHPLGVKGRAANKLPLGYGIKIHWRKPDQA